MITQAYLKKIFDYIDGNLVWKETRGMARKGQIAGTINSRGYRHIRIDNKFYQAHRLIWIFFNEKLDSDITIDHINRDRSDNRIENLRTATNSENNRNSQRSDHSSVGVWRAGNRFVANYNDNGKRHYIGRFDTQSEAIEARARFIANLGIVA